MANSPPQVISYSLTWRVQQSYTLATFVGASDPDGFVVRYVLTDAGPCGWLTYDGIKVASGTLAVLAPDLWRVGYYTGTSAGTDFIRIDAYDNASAVGTGVLVVNVLANVAPTMTGPSEWSIPTYLTYPFDLIFGLGTFFGQDSDGVVVSYRFTDSIPGAGYLTLDTVKMSGTSFTVPQNQLGRVRYVSDGDPGSNDITIEAIDDLGQASDPLALTIKVTNRPPVIDGPQIVNATTNEIIDLYSLIKSSDPDGEVYRYEFTDTDFTGTESGAGYFKSTDYPLRIVDGSFEVTVNGLYFTDYYTGGIVGSNTFTVRAIDNLGLKSEALTMTINVLNRAPTITGPTTVNKSVDQTFSFDSLISASDTDGTIAQYRFKDTTPGVAGLTFNGVKVTPDPATGVLVTVSATDLGKVGYYTGTFPGSNVIDIEAIDNQGAASAVLQMTIQTAANNPPTISGPAVIDQYIDRSFVFTPYITATDTDGAVAQYRFTDSYAGAGNLTLNGVRITGTSATVAAADLGTVGYYTGLNAGSNMIAIESIDNVGAVTRDALMMTINVGANAVTVPETPLANQAPTISGPTNISKDINETFTFGTTSATGVVVLGAADVDGTVAQYRFTDNTAGGGYLTMNGAPITGSSVTVTAANLNQVGYNMGPTEGSASIAIQSIDNLGLASATALTMTMTATTVPAPAPNLAPTITGHDSVRIGASEEFKFGVVSGDRVLVLDASDPDGTVAQYRFTQDTSVLAGGYLTLDRVRAPDTFTVSAADLGRVGYYTYTEYLRDGSLDKTIAIESIDNLGLASATPLQVEILVSDPGLTAMVSWSKFVTKYIDTSFTFSSLFTASASATPPTPDEDPAVTEYRFQDTFQVGDTWAGYFTLNGANVGGSVNVLPADLDKVAYYTGNQSGNNWIRISAYSGGISGYRFADMLIQSVNPPANQAPVLAGPATVYKILDQNFTLTSLIQASDPDSTIQSYSIADLTAGLGYLTLGGKQITGTSINVPAADLGRVGYYTGTGAGSNSIEIKAVDTVGGASSNVLTMAVVTGANNAPTILGPGSVDMSAGQTFGFTSGAAQIAASDSDGAVAQYRFTDSTPGAGYLMLNGTAAPSVFTVAAENLGQVAYYTGMGAGSNAIAIEAIDSLGTSSPTLTMTINVAIDGAPAISGPSTVSRGTNESFTFGTTSASGVVALVATGSVAQYRFTDSTPGAGYLTLNGVQIPGTSVTVSAANLGQVGYYTGPSAGSNSIAIEAIDNLGRLSPIVLPMTISVSGAVSAGNQAPIISGPATVSKGIGESFTFGATAGSGVVVLGASDTDGTVAQYRFTDSTPGAGYLTLNGVQIPGTSVTVSAANLGQIGYYTGPSAGSNSIAIEAIDNLGLPSTGLLTMTINVGGTSGTSNQAPTITGPAGVSKGTNESFAFNSLISAADADGSVMQYRFSDNTVGAGYLTLNGIAAPSVFTVAAADLAQVGYYTGPGAGSNSIAIEAIDNLGLASVNLLTMTISVSAAAGTGNQAPTISGPASVSRNVNEAFTFSSLISAGDADGTVAQYRFSDSMPGAGFITLNGAQIAGTSVTVSAANLAQVGYNAGTVAGSNTIAIEAIDNLGLASSNFLGMTINVAGTASPGGTGGTGGTGSTPNLAPTITGPASLSKATNEFFTFNSLITAADADGSVAQYRFSDNMAGAGYLTLNGVKAPSVFMVPAASLGQVGYSTGASIGSNSIAIEAIDNLGLASPNFLMMSINVAGTVGTGTGGAVSTANKAPSISGPAIVSRAANESFTFTSLISAADPDGAVAQYRFSDSTAGAGYLTLSGAVAPSVFTVSAADLGQVGYYTGLAQGSNSIAIEAIDNLGLVSPTPLLMSVNVTGTPLSSGGSSSRTVISSDGIGEGPLLGAGGLLTVEAGASAANFAVHASGWSGVISDIVNGGLRYTFSGFSEFLFNGGGLNDSVKVGALGGTGIESSSVFLNGNGGNDTLDASAADKGVVVWGGAGDDRLFGGMQDDKLHGDAGDDQFTAGKGNDVVWGDEGNDSFYGVQGRDIVNGGPGDDVLELTDPTSYTITALRGNSFVVSDSAGNLSVVRDVEHFRLPSSAIAPTNSPPETTLDQRLIELYVAAFGRAPEAEGYGFWVDREAKEGLASVADTIFSLPVVKAIYTDSMTGSQFVTAIYENVFDRAPDAAGLDFWVDMLGSSSRGELVLAMTSAALGVADGTEGKDFFQNRVDWAMFAVHYQNETHTALSPEYLHALTNGVSADAQTLVTVVGQFLAAMP